MRHCANVSGESAEDEFDAHVLLLDSNQIDSERGKRTSVAVMLL